MFYGLFVPMESTMATDGLFQRIMKLDDDDLDLILAVLDFGLTLQESDNSLDSLADRTFSFGKALFDKRQLKRASSVPVLKKQRGLIGRKIA
jgi:hypothetical protein